MKRYALHGIAGLVSRKTNRATGLPMSVYSAEQAELDTEDKWMVVCETHSTMISAPTMALANESATYPTWCEACSGAEDAE